MPKNKGKGGKKHKRGKKEATEARLLILKEDGQEYALCEKMLGGARIKAQCADGEERIALIRGKMRKRIWVNVGDLVLLGLRDFQDDKADVIHVYNQDEVRKLKKLGQIDESMKTRENEVDDSKDNECPFNFEDI